MLFLLYMKNIWYCLSRCFIWRFNNFISEFFDQISGCLWKMIITIGLILLRIKILPQAQDTVQSTFVLKKASALYEIRVLWANIYHVKSHAMTLAFSLQTDLSNELLHLLGCKNIRGQRKTSARSAGPRYINLKSGWVGNILSTNNFDLWYFCSFITYNCVWHLIHICLETESQGHGMTFNVIYVS